MTGQSNNKITSSITNNRLLDVNANKTLSGQSL